MWVVWKESTKSSKSARVEAFRSPGRKRNSRSKLALSRRFPTPDSRARFTLVDSGRLTMSGSQAFVLSCPIPLCLYFNPCRCDDPQPNDPMSMCAYSMAPCTDEVIRLLTDVVWTLDPCMTLHGGMPIPTLTHQTTPTDRHTSCSLR